MEVFTQEPLGTFKPGFLGISIFRVGYDSLARLSAASRLMDGVFT